MLVKETHSKTKGSDAALATRKKPTPKHDLQRTIAYSQDSIQTMTNKLHQRI